MYDEKVRQKEKRLVPFQEKILFCDYELECSTSEYSKWLVLAGDR
jgi:hypothetical protein